MCESITLSKSKRALLVLRFASYDVSSGGVNLRSAGAISRRARN